MILLDANVLLEMLLPGRPQKETAIDWVERNKQPFCTSMLSVHFVLHFGIKEGLTLAEIRSFLQDYPKIALLPEDYAAAMRILKSSDHEDALQLAQAERIGASAIATFDTAFARLYSERMKFVTLSDM